MDPHGQPPALDYMDEKCLMLTRRVLYYSKQLAEDASSQDGCCNTEEVTATGKLAMDGSVLELEASSSQLQWSIE